MTTKTLKEKAMVLVPFLLLLLLEPAVYTQTNGVPERKFVIAFHASVNTDKTGKNLIKELPDLQKRGINTLFLEIGYNYQWKSDPKLYNKYVLSETVAREIAAECRRLSIDLIPEINCLGHRGKTKPLPCSKPTPSWTKRRASTPAIRVFIAAASVLPMKKSTRFYSV